MNLLLAARNTSDETQIWALIIVAIVSVIGHLINRYRKKQEESRGPGTPPTVPRMPTPPTTPPRPRPRPPWLPEPEEEEVDLEPELLELPPPPRPKPTVPPMVPRSTPPTRPAPGTVGASRGGAYQAVAARPTEPAEHLGKLPASALAPPPPALSPVEAAVARMLRDPSQLQAAFVVSELLSPPLALRDEP